MDDRFGIAGGVNLDVHLVQMDNSFPEWKNKKDALGLTVGFLTFTYIQVPLNDRESERDMITQPFHMRHY